MTPGAAASKANEVATAALNKANNLSAQQTGKTVEEHGQVSGRTAAGRVRGRWGDTLETDCRDPLSLGTDHHPVCHCTRLSRS